MIMRKTFLLSLLFLIISAPLVFTQEKDEIIQGIVTEAYENSHLETLAYELIDNIGPRLVGTPQM